MGSVYGNRIRITLFGESHGKAVGCVIDGLPAGLLIDRGFIARRLNQRKYGTLTVESYRRGGRAGGDAACSAEAVEAEEVADESITAESAADEASAESSFVEAAAESAAVEASEESIVRAALASGVTQRKESLEYTVYSGLSPEDRCYGSPLTVVFENADVRRSDYKNQENKENKGSSENPKNEENPENQEKPRNEENPENQGETGGLYRPGHADYVSAVRSRGFADLSGGGHFSGRLTAPLVLAGSLCEQILSARGVEISARIVRIGEPDCSDDRDVSGESDCSDRRDASGDSDGLDGSGRHRSWTSDRVEELRELLRRLDEEGDSVGAEIEVRIDGLPVGVGAPFFDTLEGEIARLVFAVPAVKGISFGTGFGFAARKGSEVVDAFRYDLHRKTVFTEQNHNGGINGGISNGMPVEFRVVVKPAASIRVPVQTLNFRTLRQETLVTPGRHDKCIALRAAVAIVSATALAVMNRLEDSEMPEAERHDPPIS